MRVAPVALSFVISLAVGSGCGDAGIALLTAAESPREIGLPDHRGAAVVPAVRFSNLRVCPYESFSQRLGRCVRDERRAVVVSSRFVCSVTVNANARTNLRAQWTYEGVRLSPFLLSVRRGVRNPWIRFDVGAGFPLPGGSYRCEFSAGRARVSAMFVSGGPKGDIVTTVVCDTERTIMYGDFPVCRADEAGTVIESPSAVVCLGMYPKVPGRRATIALVREGELMGRRIYTVTAPMIQIYARFSTLGRETMLPGHYLCRFSLDDAVIAETPFEVADAAANSVAADPLQASSARSIRAG
jgi:hypothetical protein